MLLEKRYDERLDAMEKATATALTAVEKQTAAAFAANKESVVKAENSQKDYNHQHNDLTRKMEVQAEKFVLRERLDDVAKALELKTDALKLLIDALQKHNAAGAGRREVVQEHRATAQWTIGQIISVAFGFVGVAAFVFAVITFFLKTKP